MRAFANTGEAGRKHLMSRLPQQGANLAKAVRPPPGSVNEDMTGHFKLLTLGTGHGVPETRAAAFIAASLTRTLNGVGLALVHLGVAGQEYRNFSLFNWGIRPVSGVSRRLGCLLA